MRKLKFYLLGLIPGLIFVGFILNQKGVGCSGYLPSSRVVAESRSKNFIYSATAKAFLSHNHISETAFKDSIFKSGEIDFEQSQAQKMPCPEYLMLSPEAQPRYRISFQKCDSSVTVQSVEVMK